MYWTPMLCWYDKGGNLISSAVSGKEIQLVGHYLTGHSPFTIRKKSWLANVPGISRRLGSTFVTNVPTNMDMDGIRSSKPWVATTVRSNPTTRDVYFFENKGLKNTYRSGELTVSPLVDVTFETFQRADISGKLGVEMPIPGNLPIGVRLGGGLQKDTVIKGRIASVIDPAVELDLIVPWGQEDNNLRRYVEDSAEQLIEEYLSQNRFKQLFLFPFEGWLRSNLVRSLDPWLRETEALGVEMRISENRLNVSPYEDQTFTINISFSRPTQFIFAVRIRDINEPERFVISDLISVYVIDGDSRVLLFPSEIH